MSAFAALRRPSAKAFVALAPLLAATFLLPEPAGAAIPDAARALGAIASTNRTSGRDKSLQLEVTMRVDGESVAATGELVSHPSGLARLELRGNGRVDRYLLSGSELEGTTNGEPLGSPRGYLQPIFLMQPASASTLASALTTFGIDSGEIGIAPCGDADCFVFGDSGLSAPLIEGPDGSRVEVNSGPYYDDGALARFWVGMDDLQIRRIDRGDGRFVVFGPMRSFSKIKVPEWFEVHDPSQGRLVRFEVESAVQVNAPAKAFNRDWLYPSSGY